MIAGRQKISKWTIEGQIVLMVMYTVFLKRNKPTDLVCFSIFRFGEQNIIVQKTGIFETPQNKHFIMSFNKFMRRLPCDQRLDEKIYFDRDAATLQINYFMKKVIGKCFLNYLALF